MWYMDRFSRLGILALAVLILCACRPVTGASGATAQTSLQPTLVVGGATAAGDWQTATPEEQGIDSEQLLAALDFAQDRKIPLHSLIVIRNGKIVLDTYMHPYTAETRQQVYSVTKSVLSALIGIAMDQGSIKSLDQPVIDFFPDWQIANLDDDKKAITLRHLLNMSSGLDFTGAYTDYTAMVASDNWGKHVLDLPMRARPGEEFVYCDGCAHLVVFILANATGMPVRDFADKYLFEPLGITDYTWHLDSNGQPLGYFGIGMKPHDIAKLATLYLQKGRWGEQQVVPEEWVDLTTCATGQECPFQKVWDPIGYGHFWWMFPDFYAAIGRGGQYSVAVPDKDLVVAMTCGGCDLSDLLGTIPFDLVTNQILPAVVADQPLPANPDALAALNTRVVALAQPEPAAVAPLPELAGQVDGQVYEFAERPLDLFFFFYAEDLVDDVHENFGDVGTFDVKALSLSFAAPEAKLTLVFTDDYTVDLAVGLDGVRRVSDTRYGPFAARGEWHADDEFRLAIEPIGNSHVVQLTLLFGDTPIQVVGREIWEDKMDTWAGWPAAQE